MSFTVALDRPPRLPSAVSKFVNSDDTPSKEFASWLTATAQWMDRAYLALLEGGTVTKTVAQLPSALGIPGVRYVVVDATATTFYSGVVGGGANVVPVFSDGSNWRIG